MNLNETRSFSKRGSGYRKRREGRLRLSVVVSSSICHTTTTSPRHTHTKPLAPFLSFVLFSFSLRMSYSSVAIGYLAVLLLMSITSSLFVLCGKQQDQN